MMSSNFLNTLLEVYGVSGRFRFRYSATQICLTRDILDIETRDVLSSHPARDVMRILSKPGTVKP